MDLTHVIQIIQELDQSQAITMFAQVVGKKVKKMRRQRPNPDHLAVLADTFVQVETKAEKENFARLWLVVLVSQENDLGSFLQQELIANETYLKQQREEVIQGDDRSLDAQQLLEILAATLPFFTERVKIKAGGFSLAIEIGAPGLKIIKSLLNSLQCHFTTKQEGNNETIEVKFPQGQVNNQASGQSVIVSNGKEGIVTVNHYHGGVHNHDKVNNQSNDTEISRNLNIHDSKNNSQQKGLETNHHNIPPRPYLFLGRKDLLTKIHQKLISDRTNILLLTAIGGIGKTTLVQEYLYKSDCQNHFPRIIYIFVNNNLQVIFRAKIAEALQLDVVSFPNEDDKLKQVKQALNQLEENILIVIDNINEEDVSSLVEMKGHFEETKVKYLITTRTFPQVFHSRLQVPELNQEDALLLFVYHYHPDHLEPDNKTIQELKEYAVRIDKNNEVTKLLEHIQKHTLLIELSAKASRQKGLAPIEILEIFKAKDTELRKNINISASELQRKIEPGSHNKDRQLNATTLHHYILGMFETDSLKYARESSEKGQIASMLRFFSVLPPNDIPLEHLKKLWGIKKIIENIFEDRLDNIRQIGWIQGTQGFNTEVIDPTWYYKMHPLIQEVVFEKLQTNPENVAPLMKTINKIIEKPFNQSHKFVEYAKVITDKIYNSK